MEEKYTFKDRIVDFWDDHKDNVILGVCYTGFAVIGYKIGKVLYNMGYNQGAFDTTVCCEKYLPEAKVASTLTQIAMNQTKK